MLGIRFFEPDEEMLQWLRDYIGDRLVIDVGCGDGEILEELGLKGLGVDPYFNGNSINLLQKGIHVLPYRVQDCKKFIQGIGDKGIMLFCRPCHSNFVEDAISLAPEGMESLYITVPENITKYNDLGKYHNLKKLLHHKGSSNDNEVVYSIKKHEDNN